MTQGQAIEMNLQLHYFCSSNLLVVILSLQAVPRGHDDLESLGGDLLAHDLILLNGCGRLEEIDVVIL